MKSLVILKPDALERNLVYKILNQFTNYIIDQIKSTTFTQEMCDTHYAEHKQKNFYPALRDEMVGKKLIVIQFIGDVGDIRSTAKLVRSLYVDNKYIGPRNLIHASDSAEAAEKECKFWFGE